MQSIFVPNSICPPCWNEFYCPKMIIFSTKGYMINCFNNSMIYVYRCIDSNIYGQYNSFSKEVRNI